MSDPTRIKELRKEIESLCGNCDRPDKEELGKIIISSMALGFSYGMEADKPQEWIPCSERLPEKAGHYLCSFKKANRIDNIYIDLAYWTGGRWYGYLANEINAWMPLPKPWKEANDEASD